MNIKPILFATTLSLFSAALPSQAAPTSKASAAATRSWVSLKASTDKARYTPGQPIKVRLSATNTFKRGAYLRFSSGQRFDFWVAKQGETDVAYTWSATRMFMQSLGSLWLKPGQSQNYDATIGDEMGQLAPGKYTLVAHLTNPGNNIYSPPIEFEVSDFALSLKPRTDKTRYKIGEPVNIKVDVTNTTGKAYTTPINWGMICDFSVTDDAGNSVWTYGANLRFIRALEATTWAKGETKTLSATWNGVALPGSTTPTTLQPGKYRVQAILQTDPSRASAPVTIELTK